MVTRVWIEFRATNAHVAVIDVVYFLVFIVKHSTARVTPIRVRTVDHASPTVTERAARVNPWSLKVNTVMKSTKTSVCQILVFAENALMR